MTNKNGYFIISLDYELHWGLFDKKSVFDYEENLKNVNKVIDRLLLLSNKYGVKLTFATVGFLFANNKEELLKFSPRKKPQYSFKKLNPYKLFENIGRNETDDPFHFGNSQLKKIRDNKNHEIGTHTFSHYYCNESGQTIEEFENDILSAKKIANNLDIEIRSIVFPRNMVNEEYLDICSKHKITSYRGTEKAFFYNLNPKIFYYNWVIIRLLRFLDSYLNLTGQNTYNVKSINKKNKIINLPSSRFLRPYISKLKILEPQKINRIKKGMRHAAKNKRLFHLWWHPHNFGEDINENFYNLEKIFQEYKALALEYNFSSETMSSLTNEVKYSLE